jgi:four helix bundle protein
MAKQQGYRDLKAWQLGMDIAEVVLILTEAFPKRFHFTLCSQIERAAISIPSNIAEGYSRRTPKDQTHFYYISLGSLSELETQLILSTRRKHISRDAMKMLWPTLEEERKIIHGLIRSKVNS